METLLHCTVEAKSGMITQQEAGWEWRRRRRRSWEGRQQVTGAGQQVLEAIENAVKRVLIRQRKLQRRQTELRLLQVAIMDIDNRQPTAPSRVLSKGNFKS